MEKGAQIVLPPTFENTQYEEDYHPFHALVLQLVPSIRSHSQNRRKVTDRYFRSFGRMQRLTHSQSETSQHGNCYSIFWKNFQFKTENRITK